MYAHALSNEEFDKKLPKHVKRIGQYSGYKKPIKMKCEDHGKYTANMAQYTLRPLGGCPECSRIKSKTARPAKKHEDYVKDVDRGTKGQIKVLGSYINANTKIDHQCSCGRTWKVSPKSMLQNFGTCKQCVVKRANKNGILGLSKYHTKKISNIDFRVQGYEGECIVFLYKRGLDLSELCVHNGKLPHFNYFIKGKIYKYYPDFYYKPTNTIYEVKSTWSLGIADKKVFKVNIEKAKAVIKKGYTFKMMVSGIYSIPPIILPDCWIDMTHDDILTWMSECYGVTPSNSRGKIGR